MKKEQIRKLLKGFIVILFALSLVVVIRQFFFSSSGNYALIYQNNVLLQKIDLENSEPMEFTIYYDNNHETGYNKISVKNGSIGIIETDCPDKVCQHMGMTSSTHFPITCLPHKLVIQIVDDSEVPSDSPDIISH